MTIYKIGGNDYELVMEERKSAVTEWKQALYIDLEDVESRQGIDAAYIFPSRIETQAEQCYVPDKGMFSMFPDYHEGKLLSAKEWAVKSSDQEVDVMVAMLLDRFIFRGSAEYNSKQEVPDGLENEIREYLDHHILKVYLDAADGVVKAGDSING